MKILLINGPNLNKLGKREAKLYGKKTLNEIIDLIKKQSESLGIEILSIQSNYEGKLIDFIQQHSSGASGIIINPGALTHYGLSLRDALVDSGLPVIEVHLSNIYAREEWRAKSVIAPVCQGQITGLGYRGYIAALRTMASFLKGDKAA